MQDLTLVGLTEDKRTLLLVSDSGEEYTLPADAKLRAALRGDHARLGQLEIQMDSALRPRDIQARIRAGESPETVAQAAQTTVDRIMRYASPVLAERAHIAERAQRASVRRKAAEGPARVLGDVVAEQLRTRNVDPGSVAWDSWRREDGRWMLVADYRLDERTKRAEFIFDVQGRYVLAEDDTARWLVGDAVAPQVHQAKPSRAGSGRRLSAVSPEEELPLGDDAIEMVTQTGTEDVVGPEDSTVDLTQTAWELRRGSRRRAGRRAPTGDADWMATQASDRPAQPVEETPDAPAADTSPAESVAPEAPAGDEAPDGNPEVESTEPADVAPKKSGRKGRRASVPSWDEIMFGGGRSD